jgi:endonuclease YncB( thermonuclease family)
MRTIVLLLICIAAIGCGKPSKPRPAPAASSTPAPRQRSPLDDVAATAREAKASTPREPAVEAAPVWQVVSVHDGDTLTALDASNVQHKVRLNGIDAPEIGQAFGTVSRDGLRALVLRKSVTIHGQERDRYGRVLGRLEVEGQDVNRQMVLDGLAWHFTRYSDDATLADAEGEARAAGRGLWGDREPVPPWEWRATEKERRRQPVGR